MKQIATIISDEDYDFIKHTAKENRRTIAEEVRHALKVYYSSEDNNAPAQRRNPNVIGYYDI